MFTLYEGTYLSDLLVLHSTTRTNQFLFSEQALQRCRGTNLDCAGIFIPKTRDEKWL